MQGPRLAGLVSRHIAVDPLMTDGHAETFADAADLFRAPLPEQRPFYVNHGLCRHPVLARTGSACRRIDVSLLGYISPVAPVPFKLPVHRSAMDSDCFGNRCRRVLLRKKSRYLISLPLGQLLIAHGDTASTLAR
jgi:hypothetical protein